MALPASTLSTVEAMLEIKRTAAGLKSAALYYAAQLQAGSLTATALPDGINTLRNGIVALQANVGTAGLDAYVASVQPGYGGIFTADANAVIAAAQAVVAWLVQNTPTAGGYIQGATLNADGSQTPRLLDGAFAAALLASLQGLIAAVA